jgi:phenylpropionate dioxygenase-like ring-hydroxylating dioxygenase large terminal subunit
MPTNDRPFLLDQWYVAAKSKEVAAAPLGRRICNLPLVMFRRADGTVAALDDACPHRMYPLSKGRLVGDDIECGYHGLRFSGSGACTMIPAQATVPAGFGARAYPVVEKSALIYIWLGQPQRADPCLIPEFHENVSEGWTAVDGYRLVEAHYQLVVDNLLDLTHLTFVHPTTLAGPGIQENRLVVKVEGNRVHARREMLGVAPAPIFGIMRSFPDRIDRFQNITFIPPNHVHIRVEAAPAGARDDPDLIHHVVLNHLTPETERTTHYFWSVARTMRLDDSEVSHRLYEMNRSAFEEDAAVLKLQQQMIERDTTGAALANLGADQAIAAARRIIRNLHAAECDS